MSEALAHDQPGAHATVLARVNELLPSRILNSYQEGTQLAIDIDAEHALAVIKTLKEDEQLAFTAFVDLTAVDYSKFVKPPAARFGVIYVVMSPLLGVRVKVRALITGAARIMSVTSVYLGADWGEREAFDLFGIEFVGHPNLKRILMPDGYRDFPLRKDYPLRGRGERADFEVYRAVRDGGAESGH